jgi:hypothetical protein
MWLPLTNPRETLRHLFNRMSLSLNKKQYTQKIAIDILQILREKARGTFLWVGIACKELSRVKTSSRAVKTLENLPYRLDSLYKELLDTALKLEEAEKETIIQILSFVAVSQRPLSLEELSIAC